MNAIYRIVERATTQVRTEAYCQRIGLPSEAEARACAKAKSDCVLENFGYRRGMGL